ncbi:MAG: hypothetical protein F6J98_02365 [Moorea sp. SIO4G2]|nr:hypothetical protein [Moorena sp. SIO4G2]
MKAKFKKSKRTLLFGSTDIEFIEFIVKKEKQDYWIDSQSAREFFSLYKETRNEFNEYIRMQGGMKPSPNGAEFYCHSNVIIDFILVVGKRQHFYLYNLLKSLLKDFIGLSTFREHPVYIDLPEVGSTYFSLAIAQTSNSRGLYVNKEVVDQVLFTKYGMPSCFSKFMKDLGTLEGGVKVGDKEGRYYTLETVVACLLHFYNYEDPHPYEESPEHPYAQFITGTLKAFLNAAIATLFQEEAV